MYHNTYNSMESPKPNNFKEHTKQLTEALRFGDLASINELLTVEYINSKENKMTNEDILIYATVSGNLNIVKLMLKQEDIDVNCPDITTMTPLMHAAYLGRLEIVKELLEHVNIEPHLVNRFNKSALDLATVMRNNSSVANMKNLNDIVNLLTNIKITDKNSVSSNIHNVTNDDIFRNLASFLNTKR